MAPKRLPVTTAANESLTRESSRRVGVTGKSSSLFNLSVTPSQAQRSESLRDAIERAALKGVGSLEALRLAVCAYTVALRAEGMTPEMVLMHFKTAIHEEVFRPISETSTWSAARTQDMLTTWCINDYFSETSCDDTHAVSA